MTFLFLFCFYNGRPMVEVKLRAVFGGTADSHGCERQNTRAVSAGSSGAAVCVSCAG